jgi:2-hydroxychromene-2-carboxylate isomerase
MSDPITFYFDFFTSPYSYLASERIDELAAKYGRKVQWRPVMLGAAFKASGMPLLVTIPFKGEYSKRDFDRSARFMGIPYRFPPKFPVSSLSAARAYYWLHGQDCAGRANSPTPCSAPTGPRGATSATRWWCSPSPAAWAWKSAPARRRSPPRKSRTG